MRLLMITQKVDRNDAILGFFHRWIEEFAKHFEKVIVICLEKGEYNLPKNVEVYSLGKERGVSKLKKLTTFYYLLFTLRKYYDSVFVHMNQEYVLLAGDIWRLMGKRIYLWRNHAKGNILTRIAVLLSHKVFCTSPQSYTAKFKKTQLMPVGVDTEFFRPDPFVTRKTGSILFLGRIAPVKKVLEFIDWLDEKYKKGEDFSVTIAGESLPKDRGYEKQVREKVVQSGFSDKVSFVGAVNQEGARRLYQTHETYVNLTPAGSMDKTILESASCETSVVVANEDLKILEFKKGNELRNYVLENHSLVNLVSKIFI